jgi:hypothetical protein
MYKEQFEYQGLVVDLVHHDAWENPLDWLDVKVYATKRKLPCEVLIEKGSIHNPRTKGDCVDFQKLVQSYRREGMTGREAHYSALEMVARVKAIYEGKYWTATIGAEYEDVRGNVFTSDECRTVEFFDYWGYNPNGEEVRHKKDELDLYGDDLVSLVEDAIGQAINHALEKHDYYVLRYMQDKMGVHFWTYTHSRFKNKYAEILNIAQQ